MHTRARTHLISKNNYKSNEVLDYNELGHVLTLSVPTPQNGQTHSHNSSAIADK